MMGDGRFERSVALLGKDAMELLSEKKVAVFGLGGVGGHAVECLARGGIGGLELVDNDVVSLSDINRQILALGSRIGKLKTEAAADRVADINPDCKVTVKNLFVLPDNAGELDFSSYDYVVDAIDTVSGKLAVITAAKSAGVPVISSMGSGNKLDPTAFEVADIYSTSVCPLARVMRRELRKRGVASLKTVYSKEEPVALQSESSVPASVSFVPGVVGMILASEVIKDLLNR